MQKVLRKRVIRSLKKHFVRYTMLGLMIAMAIFLVVTIVGSAETLTKGTKDLASDSCVEDGEFEVFVPLSANEEEHIKNMDIALNEQFYYDYQLEDEEDVTLRLFKVRDDINKLHYVSGEEPSDINEIALEKRYAAEHNVKVKDSIKIAGVNYKVTGIAVTSDYDAPLKSISDTSCNSKCFGLAFMTNEAYERFKESGKAQKAETYLYTYKFNKDIDNDGLKDYLKSIKIDADQIDDDLFQEYWDRTGGVEDELRDAVSELRDATNEVNDALVELSENNDDINDGTSTIFDSYLEQTSDALNKSGYNVTLNEDNYEEELDNIINTCDSSVMRLSLKNAKKKLDELKKYKDGIKEYTNGVKELSDGTDEMAEGVNDLDKAVNDTLSEFDFGLTNMTSFLVQADNPRIYATKNDKLVDIEVGVFAGFVLFILLSYVISVFVVHSIESESSIIGTLYSMGVTKNDLLLHYITLPVVVSFVAGLVGLLIASTGVMAPMIAESSYQYFSIPEFSFYVPAYLIVYSVVVPPVVAIIVNVLVINNKLNRTPLSLIRNEVKQAKNKNINLKNMNFISAFRIRQMFKEVRSTLAVVFGMFLSLLIFMIGVNCFILCNNIAKDYANDTKFEYMYTLKYPEKEPPKDAEPAYAYSCKKKTMGYNFDVTVLGIDDDNPYFDVETRKSKVDVVVSSAFAEKFKIKKGEEVVVSDEDKEVKYAFKVSDIVKYSSGFYIFMDIDEMRDMMGEADDYYNVLFADKEIDINPGRLYSTTSRADVVKGSEVFTSLMMPMIYTLSFASIIIFILVLYLMMKVMIDRSSQNISLIKVFGYKRKEVKKLYLDGNMYIIAAGALIVIPLAKLIMNELFPFMVSNVACGLNIKAPIIFFVCVYVVILGLYFLVNAFLVRRLDKYSLAEILKNRE